MSARVMMLGILVVGIGGAVAAQVPEIKRYINLRGM